MKRIILIVIVTVVTIQMNAQTKQPMTSFGICYVTPTSDGYKGTWGMNVSIWRAEMLLLFGKSEYETLSHTKNKVSGSGDANIYDYNHVELTKSYGTTFGFGAILNRHISTGIVVSMQHGDYSTESGGRNWGRDKYGDYSVNLSSYSSSSNLSLSYGLYIKGMLLLGDYFGLYAIGYGCYCPNTPARGFFGACLGAEFSFWN